MEIALELKNLTKHYGKGKTPAVKDVSLTIAKQEVYGFLGANGAGKSTTIRTIMDFIRPTSGTVTVLGMDTKQEQVRKHIGYLAGDVVLPKNTTGAKLIHYLAQLTGNVDKAYIQELTKRFEVQLEKPMGTLSKGNRQKIGLIQAFMHKPDLLILDEPTSGLDPLMQEQFYRTIAEVRDRGAAVFLSSHSFEEVERICDRIGIIRQGELVYEGTVTSVLSAHIPRWQVVLSDKNDAEKLRASSALKIVGISNEIIITVEPSGKISEALGALSQVAIESMTTNQGELEEEFLRYYGENKEGK